MDRRRKTINNRMCGCPGCDQSLANKRTDAEYCTPKCAKRAKRIAELGFDAWPEPTPLKQRATETHCRNGHEWAPESHHIAKDGRRVCLQCRRSWMPDTCKRGHPWTPENTVMGSRGQRVCITCKREWGAAWKSANRDKVNVAQQRRRAADPKWKERSRAEARRWRAENLAAALEKARQWRKENPDRVRANNRKWATINPESKRQRDNLRRARKRQAIVNEPVSVTDYIEVLNSGPCVYCGSDATEVDHVRPLSRGGREHLSNLVPACKSCNSSKWCLLLDEWDHARVAQAVRVSEIVADELRRLLYLRERQA